MIRMTLSEYLRKPKDYRGEWTTERWDLPNWEEERKKYMGKRTLMTNVDGATCLVVEGLSLEIIDDTDWKKPDTVRKGISRQCLKFFTERGIEPMPIALSAIRTTAIQLKCVSPSEWIPIPKRMTTFSSIAIRWKI